MLLFDARDGLNYKPGGFQRSSRRTLNHVKYIFNIKKNGEINDDDDHDDDDDEEMIIAVYVGASICACTCVNDLQDNFNYSVM